MSESTERRPNVIWIFGDQHRAQAQGHMGCPNVHTPEIDRLAAEGVNFTRAVAGNPWCTPFRACLLTSRYPQHSCYRTPQKLDPQIPTIAQPFSEAGYETAYFGKWHLDGWPENEGRSAFHIIPPERRGGFDTWIGYENNNAQFDCYVHGHDAGGEEIKLYKLPGYETDALTDLLIDFLDTRGPGDDADKPFFAVLSVQPPHDPYVAPADDMGRHTPADIKLRPNVPDVGDVRQRARRDLAGYYAMVENLDTNLGRVRKALAANGLDEDTHIIFFSDHGDCHGSHGYFRKSSPWEESIRIPMILGGGKSHYTERLGRPGSVMNHVDIAPTTLGLCGIDLPDWMSGFDYSGYRRHGVDTPLPDEPDSAFLQHLVRKYHKDGIDRAWRGVVTRDGWKYVCLEGQPLMMFNLNEDPYETCNLAFNHRYKAERKRLQDRLAQWIADTGDEFELPEM
ncbi:MAG: sulfatase [Phycisphaerae bacterium]